MTDRLRRCGHPLGDTRWCPDCALAEERNRGRLPEPAVAPAAGEPQEHPVHQALPSLGLHATDGRAETCAEDATRKLAAFGAWAAREFRDSLSDVDGGSAQDAMERLGVIVKRKVTEPCGEGCVCIEYGDFPHECYAFPEHISAAIDAAVSQEPTGSGS